VLSKENASNCAPEPCLTVWKKGEENNRIVERKDPNHLRKEGRIKVTGGGSFCSGGGGKATRKKGEGSGCISSEEDGKTKKKEENAKKGASYTY